MQPTENFGEVRLGFAANLRGHRERVAIEIDFHQLAVGWFGELAEVHQPGRRIVGSQRDGEKEGGGGDDARLVKDFFHNGG